MCLNPQQNLNCIARITYTPPYDWAALVRFLKARAIPGVEAVEPHIYRRVIHANGGTGWLEVQPVSETNKLQVQVSSDLAGSLDLVENQVRGMFGLDADPETIRLHFQDDPDLRLCVDARPGLRVPGCWDGFELSIRAILGQQISVPAASTLAGRLVAAYGDRLDGPDMPAGLARLFPGPEVLASASLSEVGMPAKRRETIRAFARAVSDGKVNFSLSEGLEAFVESLLSLPGIGPWTAHYMALRLGAPDAFPAGDLGIRKALSPPNGPLISEKALLQRAERWQPLRAYAAIHLWNRGVSS